MCELPGEVVGIHHAHVHALPCFWGVGVAGIAADVDAEVGEGEGRGYALADLVGCPPVGRGEGHGVRGEDFLCLCYDAWEGDFGTAREGGGFGVRGGRGGVWCYVVFHLAVDSG